MAAGTVYPDGRMWVRLISPMRIELHRSGFSYGTGLAAAGTEVPTANDHFDPNIRRFAKIMAADAKVLVVDGVAVAEEPVALPAPGVFFANE